MCRRKSRHMITPRVSNVSPVIRSALRRTSGALGAVWIFALLNGSLVSSPARAGLEPWEEADISPLSLATLDGGRLDLEELSGRVVLVHFFATWCEPCRDELASLDRMASHFSGQAVQVLAVDVGEPESRIRRFFNSLPVGFPVLLDPDRVAMKAWGVATLPSTFILIDRRSLFKVQGEMDWMNSSTLERRAGEAAAAGGRRPNA